MTEARFALGSAAISLPHVRIPSKPNIPALILTIIDKDLPSTRDAGRLALGIRPPFATICHSSRCVKINTRAYMKTTHSSCYPHIHRHAISRTIFLVSCTYACADVRAFGKIQPFEVLPMSSSSGPQFSPESDVSNTRELQQDRAILVH